MTANNTVSFVFKDTPGVIVWPCKISVPLDGGGFQEQELKARFKVIDNDRFDELAGTPVSRAIGNTEGVKKQGDRPLLEEVLVGFADFRNAGGAVVDDAVAIPAMLALPYAVAGLVRGYMEMVGLRAAKN